MQERVDKIEELESKVTLLLEKREGSKMKSKLSNYEEKDGAENGAQGGIPMEEVEAMISDLDTKLSTDLIEKLGQKEKSLK